MGSQWAEDTREQTTLMKRSILVIVYYYQWSFFLITQSRQ